jgi:hypothetical protein
MPAIRGDPYLAGGPVAGDQPRDLGRTQAGHLLDVAPQQPTRHPALLLELVLDQHRLHPAIHLPAVFTLKTEPFTGCYQLANLLQTQLLGCVHTDIQSSASPILQPHLALYKQQF